MARDRLAAMRAQQGGGYNNEPSYPSQPSGRRQNPYAQQDDNTGYELSNVNNGSNPNLRSYGDAGFGNGRGADDMSAFYDEVSSVQDALKTYNDNVSRISDLHARSLNNMDDNVAQRNAAQLEDLMEETSALSAELKRRIKALERQGGNSSDGQIRRQQAGLLKSKFVEAIQSYQQVEQQHRQRTKQRMERQFKIVKPDATPEEVKAVVEDNQDGQIFQQALMNSNRYGESRAAYREVQERHADIQRIEKTMTELAQLFNDMSILVEQQDETINTIQTHVENTAKDTEAGLQYTEKAVDSARAARKKRWICFIIIIIILAIVGIVVGVVVAQNLPKNNNSGGGTTTVTAPASAAAATPSARAG